MPLGKQRAVIAFFWFFTSAFLGVIAPSLSYQRNTVENYNVLVNDIRVAFRGVSLFVAIKTRAYISEIRPDVPSAMVKSVVP